jgi:hypothetical protein
LKDPDISVRRKAVFIMGTLLRSSHVADLRPSHTENTDGSGCSTPTLASLNIITADDRTVPIEPTAPADPIHPNSHAANLRDPYRIATAELTLDAMREHRIVEYVIDSIINPLPHDEEGDFAGAAQDYEGKAMGVVYTYVVTCSAEVSGQRTSALSEYLRVSERTHDMPYLLDKLGLSSEEYQALVEKVNQ